jgi:hypothetical protein
MRERTIREDGKTCAEAENFVFLSRKNGKLYKMTSQKRKTTIFFAWKQKTFNFVGRSISNSAIENY